MAKGIKSIQAEICIEADTEEDARRLALINRVPKTQCHWRQRKNGEGGCLYVGAHLFFDPERQMFTFVHPTLQRAKQADSEDVHAPDMALDADVT